MKQVRIIIKETHQPPIDTPASIKMKTLVVESDKLHEMLLEEQNRYMSYEVIGAEAVVKSDLSEQFVPAEAEEKVPY